jgi:hypothetical protein
VSDEPDPRLNAESLAIRAKLHEKLYTNPTFTASIVRMEIKNKILRELAFAQPQAVEGAKLDMAYSLANFLVKQFVTESKTETEIELRLGLEMLVATEKVPKGIAHTPIIFQENRP